MDLSVIIINHNTGELTKQAVNSVFTSEFSVQLEVIVVDNSDREEERYNDMRSNLKILSPVNNQGFSHGCNLGAAASQGKYLLFLNSDVVLQKDTLEGSVTYLQNHPQIGVLGVQVLLQNGKLDHACKRGFPSPWNAFCYFSRLSRLFSKSALFNGYCLGHLDQNQVHQVDAVTGAYLMIPAELYRQLGGFDETFFMYGEDLDLCWRVKEAGYQVVYYPKVNCLHLKGQSGKAVRDMAVQYHFYEAMEIFYDRYYARRYPKWVTWLVRRCIRFKKPPMKEGAI